ncbi:MAG TPA: hypothetical protein VHW47_09635 [Acidimicrobiales bacterium]|jgi:hypothetical protein|nr:hypothetical protein [Acidimicrobiales bacterium]
MLPPSDPIGDPALWLDDHVVGTPERWGRPDLARRRPWWATALVVAALLGASASVVVFVGMIVVGSIGAAGGCGGG